MKFMTIAVLLFAFMSAVLAQTFRVDLTARMMAGQGGHGKGKAVWRIRDQGTEHQAQLQVEGERLLPNSPYLIIIGTNPAINVTTNGLGRFTYAQAFTTLDRPDIVNGTNVAVVRTTGTPVMGGTFLP